MGMTKEELKELLDELGIKWREDPEDQLLSIELDDKPCDWCGKMTDEVRTYSRYTNGEIWRAKCQDKSCKKVVKITKEYILKPLTYSEK